MTTKIFVLFIGVVLVAAACGAGDEPKEVGTEPTEIATEATQVGTETAESVVATEAPALGETLAERLSTIDILVAEWKGAQTLEEAKQAAEAAANLVVGPGGPGYGDRDGDGAVGGEADMGILPGLDGSLDGLATALESNECVVKDVLGGGWEDQAGRWDEMLRAIDGWTSSNNTMPSLASHPMRIVGWASFTLATDSLDEAHEYAGHAKLHVDISVRALEC